MLAVSSSILTLNIGLFHNITVYSYFTAHIIFHTRNLPVKEWSLSENREGFHCSTSDVRAFSQYPRTLCLPFEDLAPEDKRTQKWLLSSRDSLGCRTLCEYDVRSPWIVSPVTWDSQCARPVNKQDRIWIIMRMCIRFYFCLIK